MGRWDAGSATHSGPSAFLRDRGKEIVVSTTKLRSADRGRADVSLGLLLTLTLAAGPGWIATAAADQFIAAGDGWQTYINDRYGTRLDFPATVFSPGPPPENGDGQQFSSPDAVLEVYAFQNLNGESAASLERRLSGGEGYTNVTYSPAGQDWLVLSGFRGDTIFYEKYLFRGAVVHAFGMEFPSAAKPYYAPIVERIEDSFRGE
jgi:hypothetical protein